MSVREFLVELHSIINLICGILAHVRGNNIEGLKFKIASTVYKLCTFYNYMFLLLHPLPGHLRNA